MSGEKIKKNTVQHGSVGTYAAGFVLSIGLTLAAYIPVVAHQSSNHKMFPHEILIPAVVILAVVQLCVQLVFFLHLAQESKPRWNLVFFIATVSIVLLVVVGSIWIMGHLNYNMAPGGGDVGRYMLHEEGIQK